MKPHILFLFLSLCFFSCKKENAFDCFKSNGSETNEVRYPGPFTAILVEDKTDVYVYSGNEYKVEIIAGGNILNNISTAVEANVLTIINKNTCNLVRGYKRSIRINITVPYIDSLTNKSVGTVYFDKNYTQDKLLVKAESSGDIYVNGSFNELHTVSNGNGDIYVSGKCNYFYAFGTGTNYLFADQLSIRESATVHNESFGDFYLNTTGLHKFTCDIEQDGNIYYKGEPAVIENLSDGLAKGKLIKAD